MAEAERRRSISDRDVSASVEHFGAAVRPLCQDWELTVERWLGRGAGTPALAVRRADGTAAVFKIAEPGALDAQARVLRAGGGHGYARVLDWQPERGALLLERLGHDLSTESSTLAGQGRVLVALLQKAWEVPLARGGPLQSKASDLLAILADWGRDTGPTTRTPSPLRPGTRRGWPPWSGRRWSATATHTLPMCSAAEPAGR